MTSFITVLIIISVVYVIKLWLDYKKVAVNAPNYDKVTVITWLLIAFMAMTGIASISEQLTNYLFSLVGMEAPVHFAWKALFAYIIFVIATVLILNKGKKESGEQMKHIELEQGTGEIHAETVNLQQHFYAPKDSTEKVEEVKETA